MSEPHLRGTRLSRHAKRLRREEESESDHKLDLLEVEIESIKSWVTKRITELFGPGYSKLIEFICGIMDGENVSERDLHVQLSRFMEKNTLLFVNDLWSLLLTAQQNASGLPQHLSDTKETEVQQRKDNDGGSSRSQGDAVVSRKRKRRYARSDEASQPDDNFSESEQEHTRRKREKAHKQKSYSERDEKKSKRRKHSRHRSHGNKQKDRDYSRDPYCSGSDNKDSYRREEQHLSNASPRIDSSDSDFGKDYDTTEDTEQKEHEFELREKAIACHPRFVLKRAKAELIQNQISERWEPGE